MVDVRIWTPQTGNAGKYHGGNLDRQGLVPVILALFDGCMELV